MVPGPAFHLGCNIHNVASVVLKKKAYFNPIVCLRHRATLTKRRLNYICFYDLAMVVMKIRILWISKSNEQWLLSLMIIDIKFPLNIQSEMRTIYPLRNLNKGFGLESHGNWVRRQSLEDVRLLLWLKLWDYNDRSAHVNRKAHSNDKTQFTKIR